MRPVRNTQISSPPESPSQLDESVTREDQPCHRDTMICHKIGLLVKCRDVSVTWRDVTLMPDGLVHVQSEKDAGMIWHAPKLVTAKDRSRFFAPRAPGRGYARPRGGRADVKDQRHLKKMSVQIDSHQEGRRRPQQAHLPRRCLACRALREASEGGRMRAGLRSARRAKPAETLT